jgi:hypothetical protein
VALTAIAIDSGVMGQRRGIAAILAAAAVCLVVAGLGAYAGYAILDEDGFADRALSTLDSDEVRDDLATRIAARVVADQPRLMAGKAVIENVADDWLARDESFPMAFRGAAAGLHHTLFSDADAEAALRVPGSGAALRAELERLPGWDGVPAIKDPSLMSIGTGGIEGVLRDLAPPAHTLAVPLTIAFGVAGLALFALGIARAADRRRGIWSAGITVAVAAGLVAAGVTSACDVVLDQFDTSFGDAVVSQVWGAYLADLRLWSLTAGAAGLVVAAAAGGPRLPLRIAISAPASRGARALRAAGLLAVAAVAVALPEMVLHLALVTLAAGLVYVAAGELLRALAPPDSSARRVRAVLATGALLAVIAAVAIVPV